MVFCSLNRFIIIWKGFRFRRLNQKKKIEWMMVHSITTYTHIQRRFIWKKMSKKCRFVTYTDTKTLGIDHPSIHLFFYQSPFIFTCYEETKRHLIIWIIQFFFCFWFSNFFSFSSLYRSVLVRFQFSIISISTTFEWLNILSPHTHTHAHILNQLNSVLFVCLCLCCFQWGFSFIFPSGT